MLTAPYTGAVDRDSALPAPSGARSARWWAAFVVPIVVLAAAVGFDVVAQVEPEVLGGESARYIPPDGHRTVLRDSTGALVIAEHSRSVGLEGLLAAPPVVAATVLSVLGDQDARTAQWWRVTRTDDSGATTTDLYRLSNDGVSQVAAWGGEVGFIFEPELLLLPAVLHPDDTWRASGSAFGNGALTYEALSAAFAPIGSYTGVQGAEVPLTGGCVGVDSTVRLTAPENQFESVLVDSTVWCPGRGAVWSSGTLDERTVGQAEERGLIVAAVDRGLPRADEGESSSAVDLTRPQSLPLTVIDAFFGEYAGSVQVAVPPVALPDGRIVFANDRGDDLQWWLPGQQRLELDAVAHPGGAIIAIAQVGDGVVATTAQRAVVAYDGLGRRLWQWRGPELVLTPPIVVPGSGRLPDVLVVDRGGLVTKLSGETGEPLWSVSLGADARSPVVRVDDAVVISDERGRVQALELRDGAVRWRVDVGFVEGAAAATDGEAVALQLESGDVVELAASDGDERFSVRYQGFARSLLVTRDAVLALSDERLVALSRVDGSVLWRERGGLGLLGTPVSEGDSVVVLDATALRLIATDDGAVLDERPLDPPFVSATRHAVVSGSAIIVVDSDGQVTRSERR